MNIKRLAAFILTAAILAPSAATAAKPSATPEPTQYPYSGEYGAFEDVSKYVSEFFIDESYTQDIVMAQGVSELLRNNEPLLIELLKATLESLDDYSEFYTEQEYKEFQELLNRTFYGIGITMRMTADGYIEIYGFSENTDNAQKAGFQIGDLIYKVNGEDVTGMSIAEVRERVVGEEGTQVNITVLRDGREIELTAERVAVNAATVGSAILEDNIGYIQILSFSQDTADEFEDALDFMRKNGVKKIILDLRNNVGGFVHIAIKIAQSIVPKGKIIDVKYRDEANNMTYSSSLTKKEFDFVLLVNENTASAAEILASAMQDSKAGELVGTQTFGKAVIQHTFPLDNGSVFKLTAGQYITRNGKEINKIGLTPDIYVENTVDKFDTSEYACFDYEERTALGMKGENVQAAKERLTILGYYRDEINDVFDSALRDAIRAYQMDNDIFAYGILDIPTQTLLEHQVSDIDITDDKQLETAYERLGGDVKKLYNQE